MTIRHAARGLVAVPLLMASLTGCAVGDVLDGSDEPVAAVRAVHYAFVNVHGGGGCRARRDMRTPLCQQRSRRWRESFGDTCKIARVGHSLVTD